MASTKVTLQDVLDLNKQIYEELRALGTRVEKVEIRTSVLENFRSELAGKLAVVGAIIIIGINLLIEYVKEKIFKNL